MCPAIHINSRSWLRSSSTHEPSDPPPRVVFFVFSWPRSLSFATLLRRTSRRRFGRMGLPDRLVNYYASSRNFAWDKKNGEQKREGPLLSRADRFESGLPEPSICAPDKLERPQSPAVRPHWSPSSTVLPLLRCLPGVFVVCHGTICFGATFMYSVMILPQVHLRKPCYDFYFL